MEFKGFILDDFQEKAIHAIEQNKSVVVSAATGTGKTLIADYIIDKYLKEGLRVIYTAPIKALSNQKFKDFKKDYGAENVGIMTGDLVINPQAPIIIMTTEIYRNMLLTKDPVIEEVSYVVFDEIHYMNDPERGSVWEESIIFSPEHIRFLCLSATIPNATEFASWLENIKKHSVAVIRYSKRAVPLEHYVYETNFGLGRAKELKEFLSIPSYEETRGYRKKKKKKRKFSDYTPASPQAVIEEMNDKLPAIVFSFSRNACEEEAQKTIKKKDFATPEERKEIISTYRKYFTPEINTMRTTTILRECLSKGVGFHHAGLLPQHKEAVEELFGKGLLKVLFATETFSVGINMPAKTVIFNGLRKYDGMNFRMINSKEYFQLAGRAGRRGIDKKGYVVAIIDPRIIDIDEFIRISSADEEPIRSQFKLSYNTVINLLANHTDEEIKKILKSNFDYFIKRKKSNKQVRIMATFNNKKRILKKMGYIDENNNLTEKGYFARHIYFQELLVSEIFTSSLYKKLNDIEIIQLIAAIVYEQRQNDYFSFKGIENNYAKLLKKLEKNEFVIRTINKLSLKRMMAITGTWASGGRFKDLLSLTKLAEGDIIRLFRRIIDMIGQIKRATSDPDLRDRLEICQKRIDRDLVAVNL